MTASQKFRKKPVVVEAIQFDGEMDCLEVFGLFGPEYVFQDSLGNRIVQITTLEGTMTGHIGDYIIKGVQGELYPCKPNIFEATYEACA